MKPTLTSSKYEEGFANDNKSNNSTEYCFSQALFSLSSHTDPHLIPSSLMKHKVHVSYFPEANWASSLFLLTTEIQKHLNTLPCRSKKNCDDVTCPWMLLFECKSQLITLKMYSLIHVSWSLGHQRRYSLTHDQEMMLYPAHMLISFFFTSETTERAFCNLFIRCSLMLAAIFPCTEYWNKLYVMVLIQTLYQTLVSLLLKRHYISLWS